MEGYFGYPVKDARRWNSTYSSSVCAVNHLKMIIGFRNPGFLMHSLFFVCLAAYYFYSPCEALSLRDTARFHFENILSLNKVGHGYLIRSNKDECYNKVNNGSLYRPSMMIGDLNSLNNFLKLLRLRSKGTSAAIIRKHRRNNDATISNVSRFPIKNDSSESIAFIGTIGNACNVNVLNSSQLKNGNNAVIDTAEAASKHFAYQDYYNYQEQPSYAKVVSVPSPVNDYNTFVSHHYRITSGEIIDYLKRKKIEYLENPLKLTLKFCPFCPPHKFKSDNLYKHEIFKNSGNSFCHRCGYKGSLFDFKAAMGDLPGGLIEEAMGQSYSGNFFASPGTHQQQVMEPPITMVNITQYEMNLYHNDKYRDVLKYLTETRGLTLETLKKYRVGAGEFSFTGSSKETELCVVFPWLMVRTKGNDAPITVNRIKVRSIYDKSKMKLLPRGGSWGMFGEHLLAENGGEGNGDNKEVVITEGEFDAMIVNQATGKTTLSLPNGSNSLPVALLPRLESLDSIYLWMDFDAAGQGGIEHFANKLGILRTKIVRDITEKLKTDKHAQHLKDANECFLNGMDLNKFLENASPLSHSQILNFSDLRQSVFDELSNPKATCGIESLTLPGLSTLLKGHRRGELTVWTGATGSGKTTILSQLSLDYCVQGISTLWGSFEINNVRLIKTMLRQFSGKNLENSLDEFNYYADKFSELPLRFMKFHGSTSIDQVIDAMDYAVYVHDVRHIIIDNLQFMLSGQNGKVGEVWELQNTAIEKFRRFATHKNVHVSLVVHPRKEADGSPLGLSSVFGTVKSTQEADNVLILQNVAGENRCIDVKKNRFAGNLGRITFRFDPISLTAEELKVTELVTNIKENDENLTRTNTAHKIRPPSPSNANGLVQSPSSVNSTSSMVSTREDSRAMSTFRLNSVANDQLENPVTETSAEQQPVKKKRKSSKEDEEKGPEEMIIMRGVAISRSSSIKEFREFIKANGLGDTIKTAGRGILKGELYDKIKASVPPSSVITPNGMVATTENVAERIHYDFGVSTIKPYLKLKDMDVEIRTDYDHFVDKVMKRATNTALINESLGLHPTETGIVNLPVYFEANDTCDQLISKGIIYVKDEELLQRIQPLFENPRIVSIDTETTGLNFRSDRIRLIQLATPNQPSVIIDVHKLPIELVQKCQWLKELLTSESIVKIFHNGKFDINFLNQNGFQVKAPIFDTMIAAKLLSASRFNWSCKLANVVDRYYNLELDKSQQFSDWTLDPLFEEQILYASRDAAVLLPLYVILTEKLKQDKLDTIAQIEFNCIPAVCCMETYGIKVDMEKMKSLQDKLNIELEEATRKLAESLNVANDPNFNFNSQRQLLKALQALGVKDKNKRTLIQDTAEATLSRNAQHPAVAALREYRKTNKAVTAFTLKIPNHIHVDTGRIYPNFNQIGADSGRFSCDNPNLQQIPRDKKFRECFVAGKGNKLVIADFSQIELRIAADLAKDERMIQAYKRGDDLHSLTASLIKRKPMDSVTKEERQLAKAVNFGLIFGMSLTGFRAYAEIGYNVKLTEKEAREIYNSFFQSFSGIARWHERNKETRPTTVRTLGNRLSIFESFSFCRSLNYPVQGTSADITKESMAQLVKRVHEVDGKIVMCIHDEIILEVPQQRADAALEMLIDVMQRAGNKFLKYVPCVAVGSIGDSWAEK
ncbi:bifunctional Archaeal primase DnaG-twinkle [Babesia duncani]|uniref:Bifunctional Archaeal primase DnaG-twinkle n=1 Tax=Babesia duncani TaxID=323732 RepID=A0AAD9PM15_9APIC|nr:bifunctional Archaeal primase DnaG-twinkle [Babesia duncani]